MAVMSDAEEIRARLSRPDVAQGQLFFLKDADFLHKNLPLRQQLDLNVYISRPYADPWATRMKAFISYAEKVPAAAAIKANLKLLMPATLRQIWQRRSVASRLLHG